MSTGGITYTGVPWVGVRRELWTPSRLVKGLLIGCYCAVGCGAVLLPWLPLNLLLGHLLYDDAFYYLRIAQVFLSTGTISFDGSAPTNAPHPLWMGICIVIRAVADGEAAIHVLLSVGAALHLLQAWLVFRFLRPWCSTAITHMAALLYLMNYRILACNLSGLETPMQGLFVLLVFHYLSRRRRPMRVGSAVQCGLLLGLATFARFDLAILAAVVVVWLLVDRAFGRGLWARFKGAAAVMMTGLAVLAPWFAWSAIHSGRFVPHTQTAVELIKFTPFSLDMPWEYNLSLLKARVGLAGILLSDTANLLGLWPFVHAHDLNGKLGGILVIAAMGLITGGIRATREHPVHAVRCAMLAYAVAHFAYYFLFAAAEMRYLMPFSVILILIGATVTNDLLTRLQPVRRRLILGLAGSVVLSNTLIAGGIAWRNNQGSTSTHALNVALYDTANWVRTHTPPDAIIGSWNAGVLGYFSDRTVVNLDGVVNDGAVRAMQDRRLAEYLRNRRISYLVDVTGQIEMFMKRFGGRPNWRDDYSLAYLGSSTTVLKYQPKTRPIPEGP